MIGTTRDRGEGRSHSVWQTRRAPRGWPTRKSAIHQRRCCLGPPGIAMLVLVFDIESRVVNGFRDDERKLLVITPTKGPFD